MKSRFKKITALCGLFACTASYAGDLACYQDPRTDAAQCIDGKNIREKNGIRSSPLYIGGPNGVRKTNFTMHTNCNTGVTHLKDRDGVSFAGGDGNETRSLRALRTWMCEAKLKK